MCKNYPKKYRIEDLRALKAAKRNLFVSRAAPIGQASPLRKRSRSPQSMTSTVSHACWIPSTRAIPCPVSFLPLQRQHFSHMLAKYCPRPSPKDSPQIQFPHTILKLKASRSWLCSLLEPHSRHSQSLLLDRAIARPRVEACQPFTNFNLSVPLPDRGETSKQGSQTERFKRARAQEWGWGA